MSIASLSRRRFIEALGLWAAAPFAPAWAGAAEPALNFLAVGDWGRDGQFHQGEVAKQMGDSAAALGARFVVSVGDNFYEYGVTSAADPKWKTSFEDVYAAPSLQVPWYVVLGNHDYYGNAQAQLDYARTSPRWRLPRRYYSVRQASPAGVTVELFMLDTTPLVEGYREKPAMAAKLADQDPAAQVAWLDGALGASRADWKIVIGHHPVYAGDNSHMDGQGHGGSADLVARIDPLLQRHGVRLYMNGHDHELQHTVRGATHYVCTGAGSAMQPFCDSAGTDFCSLQSGFVACSVTSGKIALTYRDHAGQALRVVDIARAA